MCILDGDRVHAQVLSSGIFKEMILNSNATLANDQWHTVSLFIVDNEVTLLVDEQRIGNALQTMPMLTANVHIGTQI